MNTQTKTIAFLCALLMVGVAFTPVAVVADEDGNGNVAANLSVSQLDDRSVEISVTDEDDAPVEGVDVTVELADEADENDDADVDEESDENGYEYEGLGEHTTDEDGFVTLAAPTQDVTVEIAVDEADLEETVELLAADLAVAVSQGPDASVTITVTDADDPADGADIDIEVDEEENGDYADAGSYDNVADGELELSAPEETVDVTIEATYADQTESIDATLYNASELGDETFDTFGERVSGFVHSLQDEGMRGFGPLVASFVTEHNPGNAPDHAGPPGWLTGDDDRERGPPEHAGPNGDDGDADGSGPPEHAGPPWQNDVDEDDEDGDADEAEADNGHPGGGPDGAGPPGQR